MSGGLTETLGQWCSRLHWDQIPAAEQALVALRVRDTLGLVIAGCDSAAAEAVLGFVSQYDGSGPCALIGRAGRLPAPWCALAHGTLAHAWDFDDTFPDCVVHPGSVVIPAALAVGEEVQADAQLFGAAVTLGYEVAARIGKVAGRRFHARGFHASGIVGPFAAAAAAGRLYGLSGAQFANAFGLCGSMAGGLLAFLNDGAWSKWLHLGWAAHSGIIAAQLAQRGFAGPARVLEGPHGLYDAFLGHDEVLADEVLKSLGKQWLGSEARVKSYPGAHVVLPYIDSALNLRQIHHLVAEDIEKVVCSMAPWAIPIVCEPRIAKLNPSNALEAIASLPYLVAAALTTGRVDLDTLGEAARGDTATLAMADRVVHLEVPELVNAFDGRIEIVDKTGQTAQTNVGVAAIDADKLRAKFRANAARHLPIGAVANIDAVLDTRLLGPAELMRLTADQTPP